VSRCRKNERLTDAQKAKVLYEFLNLPRTGLRGTKPDRQCVIDLARRWDVSINYIYDLAAKARKGAQHA
jgi:hypothetical protein